MNNRQMKLHHLAERSGVSLQRLERAASGDFDLNEDDVAAIAKELAVPVAALFFSDELTLAQVPDFRKRNPRLSLFEAGTIAAIGFVEKVSLALAEIPSDLNIDDDIEAYTGGLTKSDAKTLAKTWRKEWGITDAEQLEWRSAHKVYASLRSFIESKGIFVLHRSFGTDEVAGVYTKVNGGPHSILINSTKSSKARKLFTLAHEFAHVLLRASGASNPSILKNRIETFCNQFAAYLLAPSRLVRKALNHFGYNPSESWDHIRLLAKNLGVSQQCTVLRLVDLGVFSASQYGAWRKQFTGPVPPGDMADPPQTGSGDDNTIASKRTLYGSALIQRLANAKRDGWLDDIDIYKIVGLKPKYQKPLLGI